MKAEKNILFLFTNEFPCTKTLEPYIEHELPFLAKEFAQVIIVPGTFNAIEKAIPDNVQVINIYDNQWFKSTYVSKIITLLPFLKFYLEELFDAKSISKLQLKNIVTDYKSFYNAVITANAIIEFCRKKGINLGQCAFYSYWFFHPVITLSVLKKKKLISNIISRGHLGDLYLDQFPELNNFYNFKIKNIDKLLVISSHALSYLNSVYPQYSNKFEVARLAVSDMGLNPEPTNEFVVVSCSTYSERKRVDLLASLLSESPIPLTWYHFGYVPDAVLTKYDNAFANSKIKAVYKGDVPNNLLMEFYKSTPVNVIVNLSTSEGLPFSLIEATSFGIPSIATNVNGTPDVVTNSNGFLLPVNFDKHLFYNCLEQIKQNGKKFREGARALFLNEYNAHRNYKNVIDCLKK